MQSTYSLCDILLLVAVFPIAKQFLSLFKKKKKPYIYKSGKLLEWSLDGTIALVSEAATGGQKAKCMGT